MVVFKFQNTGKRYFDRRLFGRFGGRTADVEGSHRQLGTRFTDRLSGNNTDRFTDIDRRTAGQIASVAGGADAVFAFAGQNRTDLNLFDAGFSTTSTSSSVISLPFLTSTSPVSG